MTYQKCLPCGFIIPPLFSESGTRPASHLNCANGTNSYTQMHTCAHRGKFLRSYCAIVAHRITNAMNDQIIFFKKYAVPESAPSIFPFALPIDPSELSMWACVKRGDRIGRSVGWLVCLCDLHGKRVSPSEFLI